MAKQVKPSAYVIGIPCGHLFFVQVILLPIQLPVNTPGEAAEGGPSAQNPTPMQETWKKLLAQFQPGGGEPAMEDLSFFCFSLSVSKSLVIILPFKQINKS